MKRNIIKYVLAIALIGILLAAGIAYAEVNTTGFGYTGGGGQKMNSTQFSVGGAGTEYSLNYTDSNGTTQQVTVFLQDGEKRRWRNARVYGE